MFANTSRARMMIVASRHCNRGNVAAGYLLLQIQDGHHHE
jgi:hypothetical protein